MKYQYLSLAIFLIVSQLPIIVSQLPTIACSNPSNSGSVQHTVEQVNSHNDNYRVVPQHTNNNTNSNIANPAIHSSIQNPNIPTNIGTELARAIPRNNNTSLPMNIRQNENSLVLVAANPVNESPLQNSNEVRVSESGRIIFTNNSDRFKEYLIEQIKAEISQGNYNGSSSGTGTNSVFAQTFNNIRSTFRQKVAETLFNQPPLDWNNGVWPEQWTDEAWSSFLTYLRNLPNEQRTALRELSTNWGQIWQDLNTFLTLPSGEINFDFTATINGQERLVQVRGSWGQYFSQMFYGQAGAALWQIRDLSAIAGGSPGNNNNSNGSSNSGNNSGNQNQGNNGTLSWTLQEVNTQTPTSQASASNRSNRQTRTILMATLIPSLSALGFSGLIGFASVTTPTLPNIATIPATPEIVSPPLTGSAPPAIAVPVMPTPPATVAPPVFHRAMW